MTDRLSGGSISTAERGKMKVIIDIFRWQNEHEDQKPKGVAWWGFGNTPYSIVNVRWVWGSYSQAKKKAIEWAKEHGYTTVYLLL